MYRSLVILALFCVSVATQADTVVLQNVRIFNGVDARLTAGHVLVSDGLIAAISSSPIEPPAGARVIDAGDRVLSPGFIDLHVHLAGHVPPDQLDAFNTLHYVYAVKAAKHWLDSGFTTIRDAGGTHPHFVRAIDSGAIPGPRVFPSGAYISQTAGHGDWRNSQQGNPSLGGGDHYLYDGTAVLVDGAQQFLAAARENLRLGATQIKIMGGGGVMSESDPIDSLQSSPEEIRAAVQAASDFGTYVHAHAYSSEAVRRLVENGVRCIEHGLLIDDATAKFVKQNDVVISTQLVVYRELANLPGMTAANLSKLAIAIKGQENLIKLIRKYDIRTGFSTDLISGMYPLLTREFTERAQYWTPAEVMVQATSESAAIIRMSGRLNRYGNFGEIREGWLADLVLIDGEPLDDISVLREPDKNLVLIMKGGEIVKSLL